MLIRLAHASIAVLVAATVAAGQGTTRVSVGASGAQADQASYSVALSSDARFIAFSSSATNLVPGDTNGHADAFVRDQLLGVIERVSLDPAGGEADGHSGLVSISGDGRYVAFESAATNLVVGDTNGVIDIFVRDRQVGTTLCVSVDSLGVEGNGASSFPAISSDGRFIAFLSYASNLVANDSNGFRDVFVHDLQSRITERINVSLVGAQANSYSGPPSLSADGRFVAFDSNASNLIASDLNNGPDVFVHDRQTGATELVSLSNSGAQGSSTFFGASISADGRFIAFTGTASSLGLPIWGAPFDIIVRDRQSATTEVVSVATGGGLANDFSESASISADGRYVAFWSYATNLVPGDTNGAIDVFVHGRLTGLTERASVSTGGLQGDGYSQMCSLAADGRTVGFSSQATNLVAGDTNAATDIFARDRGLADCNGNGIADDIDVQSGISSDCNGNTIPDECDLQQGPSADCDGDGLLDCCEIAGNPALDLNHDGGLDTCPMNCQPSWQRYIGGYDGTDNAVAAMSVCDDGTGPALYVGGYFHTAGGVAANGIAKWDGATWSALGTGVVGGGVLAVASFDDGTGRAVYAGGAFTSAGGVPANGIAKWNGQTWSALGGSLPPYNQAYALASYDSGTGEQLYLGTSSGVLRWDGTSLTPVLIGPQSWTVFSMAVFDDGAGPALFLAGADGWTESGMIVRWDGTAATQYLGPSHYYFSALAVHDDGAGPALYSGTAHFISNTYGFVAKWNGSGWGTLGSLDGSVRALTSFDDGSGPALVASTSPWLANNMLDGLASWDGSTWSVLGVGANARILSLCPFDDGEGRALYAGGEFTALSQFPATRIARWGQAGGCEPTGVAFCEPGAHGVMACPCGNPPTTVGRGCNNSSGTGGAQLTTTGFARLGLDNLVFSTNGEKPGASSLVFQCSATQGTGLVFGQGVRCVTGSAKRLYLKAAIAGSITAPGANDPSVSARSAALGSPIAPGMHRYYGVYYRDPIILGGCPASNGFNITQQIDVLWHP